MLDRRASTNNNRTLFFGLLSYFLGIVAVANIWFFLYYTWSPVEVYAAADQRLLQMNYTRALLPTLVLAILFPAFTILLNATHSMNDKLETWATWFPVILPLSHRFWSIFTVDTTKYDRLHNVEADLPYIRVSITIASIASAVTWRLFMYGNNIGLSPQLLVATLNDWPQVIGLYYGSTIWLLLLFRDLKKAGMLHTSWVTLLACLPISILVTGPSTTLLVGWAWREEILASRRHSAALTKAG